MNFLDIFKKIGSFFVGLFTSKQFKSAVAKLSKLAEIGLPIVELVAVATPTQADDLLLAAAKSAGLSIKEIYTSTNELIRDGGRQRLAAEALKIKLLQLLEKGKPVKLDDFILETSADVLALDKTTLITAVQSAVFFYKQLQGKK